MSQYTSKEVEVLVSEYQELCAVRHKSWIQVRLLDVERASKRLSKPLFEAVILCGVHGLTMRTAGVLVGKDPATMLRRYMRGIDGIVTYLNGGK